MLILFGLAIGALLAAAAASASTSCLQPHKLADYLTRRQIWCQVALVAVGLSLAPGGRALMWFDEPWWEIGPWLVGIGVLFGLILDLRPRLGMAPVAHRLAGGSRA